MRTMTRLGALLVGALLLLAKTGLAQPYTADEHLAGEETDHALGITILGNPALRFSSVDDYRSGVSVDHVTLELSVGQLLQWTLQLRASGDLQNGMQSIPISLLTVQPLNVGSATPIILSTANQTLLSGQLTRSSLLSPTFRYRVRSDKALLKPGGTYSTTLIFTYTAL